MLTLFKRGNVLQAKEDVWSWSLPGFPQFGWAGIAHLPGAQALEEEVEGRTPHDGSADDAEQGSQRETFTAPELQGKGRGKIRWKPSR